MRNTKQNTIKLRCIIMTKTRAKQTFSILHILGKTSELKV
jgi:hypothetical protein